MNLVSDQWMRVKCRDGAEKVIAPYQLTAFSGDETVVDVVAPRADLKGALYQFLIGLVQTCFAPRDEEEWEKYWFMQPELDELKCAIYTYKDVFDIDSEKHTFMQSYDDNELLNEPALPLEDIVGGTLSTETRKKNRDHFVKRGDINQMSPYWAVISLFSVQIYGVPAWGQHRVGLRGNGPLTTIIMPDESKSESTLWHKIWVNILSQETALSLSGDWGKVKKSDIFPWMGKTRISHNKRPTIPEDCHPFQHYWAMPRRIRLVFEEAEGICDLTGETCTKIVTGYRRLKDGVYYSGGWLHPLTPYFVRADQIPNSIKVKSEGIIYSYWLGLIFGDQLNNRQCAKVVSVYGRFRREIICGDMHPLLWAFGYHAINADILCWYESNLPLFNVKNALRDEIHDLITVMVDAVVEVIGNVRKCVKEAWFNTPKNAKGDMSFLDAEFFSQTELCFYVLVEKALGAGCDEAVMTEVKQQWSTYLYGKALTLFDHWALSASNEDGDMKRSVKARTDLEKWLRVGKKIKKLAA